MLARYLAVGSDAEFSTSNTSVYATNLSTGAPVWQFDAEFPMESSPALNVDDSLQLVLAGSFDSQVIALNRATGSFEWGYQTGHVVFSSPAITTSGRLFVGSYDNSLYALKSNAGVFRCGLTRHKDGSRRRPP